MDLLRGGGGREISLKPSFAYISLHNQLQKMRASPVIRAVSRTRKTLSQKQTSITMTLDMDKLPYKLLYHHQHPDLLPARRPGSFQSFFYHLSTSFSVLKSLATSQSTRDSFIELTGNQKDQNGRFKYSREEADQRSIIKTGILSQSDMGFMKIMSLFQELNNPLLVDDSKFDLRDFLLGCPWALEKFHENQYLIMKKTVKAKTNDEQKEKLTYSNFPMPTYDFIEVGQNDHNSVESTYMSCTTPSIWELTKVQAMMQFVLGFAQGSGTTANFTTDRGHSGSMGNSGDNPRFDVVPEETEVTNTALLAARVEEVFPPIKKQENESDDPDAPLEDDSFRIDENARPQVVCQLDVMYELSQVVRVADEKSEKVRSVYVGQFETCLQNDPNGDDVQWRLSSYRPAVEFGYFDNY